MEQAPEFVNFQRNLFFEFPEKESVFKLSI